MNQVSGNTQAQTISRAGRWGRWLLALAAGALAALALPPWHAWPVLFFALGALVWLLDDICRATPRWRARARKGALVLYLFALGWFAVSLSWIGEAFMVEAERFAALRPLAWLGLPAFLALFLAAAGAIIAATWRGDGWRIAQLAAAMTLADMLRGHLLGGFPWNLFAHVLPEHLLALMQAAGLVGVYGLSFFVLLWAATPALVVLHRRARPRAAMPAIALSLLTLASALVYGLWRLQTPAGNTDTAVIIVQPNVAQREKWRPENRERIFQRLLRLSREGLKRLRKDASTASARAVAVIWPESAVPFLLDKSPEALEMIGEMLSEGQFVITGALRRVDRASYPGRREKLHNSVLVIDHKGRIRAVYDKRRLVPFGETLPLAFILEPLGLRKLVILPSGFIAGESHAPLKVPPLPPFEAFVCYEIIFPGLPGRAGRAGWLVNVTNDGWFGLSAGPWQHLQAARFRAIEQGLPLARAANTGISAIIDSHGQMRRLLPLGRQGVLVAPLPAAAAHAPLYPHIGNLFLGLALLFALMLMGKSSRVCELRQVVKLLNFLLMQPLRVP